MKCECGGCGLTFSGLEAFDRHRVGPHGFGTRRCLSPAEMSAGGMQVRDGGVWGGEPMTAEAVARLRTKS